MESSLSGCAGDLFGVRAWRIELGRPLTDSGNTICDYAVERSVFRARGAGGAVRLKRVEQALNTPVRDKQVRVPPECIGGK